MPGSIGQSDISALTTPVQFLKGVGPDRSPFLEKLGLKTAQDVLFFFPRDYKEFVDVIKIGELSERQSATVCGVVEEIEQRTTSTNTHILGILIRQDHEYLRATWFNQPFMRERFVEGQRVALTGEAKRNGLRWQMTHPRVHVVDSSSESFAAEIQPVYRLTENIKQSQIGRIVKSVVDQCAALVPEVFPEDFLKSSNLLPIHEALKQIHRPDNIELRDRAVYRFIYQELFIMQLALGLRQQQISELQTGVALPNSAQIDARIKRLLPFELTKDQTMAIGEIAEDMATAVPMNRLLQGDVGTGKTAVAAYAMLLTVANNHQAVLMAPTETLAQQHHDTLLEMLVNSRVEISLLTGSNSPKDRQQIQTGVESGEINLLVATQAVLQTELKFANLGLIVIDEQHKFGVRQRANLREGSLDPHYLVMTATPIPRTIAMTMYGDLEVSVLREQPAGRSPVKSYWATEDQRSAWWEFFRKKLNEGRQGFVISPVVDQDDDNLVGAEQVLENLVSGELADFRLDVLHGRMSSAEKSRAMESFRDGSTQVLVSTSAVEVGIDVPNATIMAIENANRFGLAQLHQLRGRVSRGKHQGVVCIFADVKTELARERLEAFVSTGNGFDLAEIDFQLRGPGELFGTKQHGLPPLRIANLQRDTEIIQMARTDARSLLKADPELKGEQWRLLRRRVLARYGAQLELSGVG